MKRREKLGEGRGRLKKWMRGGKSEEKLIITRPTNEQTFPSPSVYLFLFHSFEKRNGSRKDDF